MSRVPSKICEKVKNLIAKDREEGGSWLKPNELLEFVESIESVESLSLWGCRVYAVIESLGLSGLLGRKNS